MTGGPKRPGTIPSYGRDAARLRRPFWLPASNYYILAVAIAIALFFVIWGILHDGGDETPWVPAGIGASLLLASAVFLREVILRSARRRFLTDQRRLDQSVRAAARVSGEFPSGGAGKLSIEQNSALLKELKKKSDAAKVLGTLAVGHKEVSEFCREYLLLNAREMANVGVGSPRLAALRRGREIAEGYHRYHILQWAEIETRSLTNEARLKVKTTDKIEAAQRALMTVESAREFYPTDPELTGSADALKEFIATIKVSDLVERAERAAFKGNLKHALNLYTDALYFLKRETTVTADGEAAIERIGAEIDKITALNEAGGTDITTNKQ